MIKTLVLLDPLVSGKTAACSALHWVFALPSHLLTPFQVVGTTSNAFLTGVYDSVPNQGKHSSKTSPELRTEPDVRFLARNQNQTICPEASSFWAALLTSGLGYKQTVQRYRGVMTI